VRRADFWTLYCPEFPLRKAPRITVRGHPVQNDSVPLRKALLRSRIVPWSTRRPCGPLAFRRATEGSRVPRKGWGVKRGRETLVSLPLLPPPPGGGNPHAMPWRTSPAREGHSRLQRRAAVSAEGLPSGGLIPSCSPHGAQRAPPGSLRAAPNAAATGSASHSPPQCSSLPPRPLPSRHPIQMVIPAYFFLRFSLFSALLSAPLPYYVPPRPLSSSVSADKIHLQNPEYFAQSTVYKNARIQYNDREHRGSVHGTIWKNPPLRSGP